MSTVVNACEQYKHSCTVMGWKRVGMEYDGDQKGTEITMYLQMILIYHGGMVESR